jgi:NADPH:quinone reductase-like Zn-dependent oxidoreductase
MALQLAHAAGAEVHVTSGSREKLTQARMLGAAGGYDYNADDFAASLRAGLSGVDVVFDGAPARGYKAYAKCLGAGARVIIYGSTGGGELALNVTDLFLRNLSIIGTNVGNEREFCAMLDFASKHRIVPVVDATFALDEAGQALRHLADAHGFGKVVVVREQ